MTTQQLSEIDDKEAISALPLLCREYREQCELESGAKAVKKVLMAEIKEHAERACIEKVTGDGWLLTKVTRESKSIVAERLLEKGVGMKTIEYATEVRESSYYQVREHE